VQPSNPAPAKVDANPPVNNVPPARNDRPNGANRGQRADKPASTPESTKPADQQVNQPPKDQPSQKAKDKKAREKQKNQDDQLPQR
jgi:hypothetical protein